MRLITERPYKGREGATDRRIRPSSGGCEHGFTLLEVMIALGVFAIVATAITYSTAGALSQTERIRDRTQANLILESHLSALRLSDALNLGSVRSEQTAFDRKWQLEQRVETPQSDTWGQTLRRVTVTVSLRGADSTLASRVTLEPLP